MKTVDLKLEVVAVPVADIDRAKRFYGETLGWRLDGDFVVGDEFRGLQFTPPGSQCSIHFGKGVTPAAPGSAKGLFLVVTDLVAARTELVDRDVKVSEIAHRPGPGKAPIAGLHPERRSYSSFATFDDFAAKQNRDDHTIRVEHGKPLLFGAQKNKGLSIDSRLLRSARRVIEGGALR